MSEPEYPECERLAAVSEQSQVVGEFVDWLMGQGIQLCAIPEEYDHTWVPTGTSIERLLADFFGIDMVKVERERRAMLEHQRELARRT